MEIRFCGVGEAFDEGAATTAILVIDAGGRGRRPLQVLLDCGFTAAPAFWRSSPAPAEVDAVWLSHFHGDHFFGLPQLLLRLFQEGRTRPLTIVGPAGVTAKVQAVLDLAYPNLRARLTFPLECITAQPGQPLPALGLTWSVAATGHSQPCLGLRLAGPAGTLYYSGDGPPTAYTLALAQGCDLIVHEAFGLEPVIDGHATVKACIDFARQAGCPLLALVHMDRNVRRARAADIRTQLADVPTPRVVLPMDGDRLTI